MKRTDFEVGAASYARIVMTPELKDRLVREAHRARSKAMGYAVAGLARAIGAKLRRWTRITRVVLLRAGQHANAALGHAEPPARRC